MKTLHEMAVRLQEFIIEQQQNAHDVTGLKVNKYSNLKLSMSLRQRRPHIVVTIGISEASYDLSDCTRIEGGLGADEKYVKKWIESATVIPELREIYDSLEDLVHEEGSDGGQVEGEATSSTVSRSNWKRTKSIDDVIERRSNIFRNYLKHSNNMMDENEITEISSNDDIQNSFDN